MGESMILQIVLIPFLLCGATLSPQASATVADEAILRLVLLASRPDSGYAVIVPTTGFGDFGFEGMRNRADVKSVEARKTNICENFLCQGYDISSLLDTFIVRNSSVSQIKLESCVESGYLIDHDKAHVNYFQRNRMPSWKEWHQDHPKAYGLMQVSLPACDAASGFCLVFVGTLRYELAGVGYLILYRYEAGMLKELSRQLLWEV
jgi:hypothetical protein